MQQLGAAFVRSVEPGAFPFAAPQKARLECVGERQGSAAAKATDSNIRRIGAGPLLLDPHRLAALFAPMQEPFPVKVLQVALLAGADEPDRRDVHLFSILALKLLATAGNVELGPANQAPPPLQRRVRFRHLLAGEPRREHANIDACRLARVAVVASGRRCAQTYPLAPRRPLVCGRDRSA